MNVELVLEQLDKAVNENRGNEVEGILTEGIQSSLEHGDEGAVLQLLNELLGYYREVGRTEDSYQIADSILSVCEQMGLVGSIPYATSLLNIANAYRAGGRLEESLAYYNNVEEIYKAVLPKDSMLVASFYNNKALLFQEMGQNENAAKALKTALSIVEKAGEPFETAVTHANLANTFLGMMKYDEAYSEASLAKDMFEEHHTEDSHYASALYAMGICLNNKGKGSEAEKLLSRALKIMEDTLGRNEFYYRIRDELLKCEKNSVDKIDDLNIKGIDLSRNFYEEYFKTIIDVKYPSYRERIAVGLVGKGSDCYGFDDALSLDHDYGPGFCVWLTKEDFDQIGQELQKEYDNLPDEYEGVKRAPVVSGSKRRGVFVIEEFYRGLLGKWPITDDYYAVIPDYALSTAVNGEVFTDPLGQFTEIREKLMKGYPARLLYTKRAEAAAGFSQCAQYNHPRMKARQDDFTSELMLMDGLKDALKLAHYIENKYPPHDKWLFKSAGNLVIGSELIPYIERKDHETVGKILARKMYENGFISDIDDYLDHHTQELLFKAGIAQDSIEELADKVTKYEFKAFDKVKNEGGRAYCQDDYFTFEIMRKSQYLTWNREMLMQYLYDFDREYRLGHNLITEKYGRMMISTAPEEYEKIKDNFPEISKEKSDIIEAVVAMQVKRREEFSTKYPKLSGRARTVHTDEDLPYDTSYETYLRGEISTYSDKMLELYARYIVDLENKGVNVTEEIMKNSVKMYGYSSLEDAERKM